MQTNSNCKPDSLYGRGVPKIVNLCDAYIEDLGFVIDIADMGRLVDLGLSGLAVDQGILSSISGGPDFVRVGRG